MAIRHTLSWLKLILTSKFFNLLALFFILVSPAFAGNYYFSGKVSSKNYLLSVDDCTISRQLLIQPIKKKLAQFSINADGYKDEFRFLKANKQSISEQLILLGAIINSNEISTNLVGSANSTITLPPVMLSVDFNDGFANITVYE